MPEYLYLDIETLPTSDPAAIAEITASITPPGSYKKQETIAEWEREAKPTLVREAIDKTALNGAYGKICCIGWAWDDNPPETVISADEREVIFGAIAIISGQKVTPRYNAVVVGHNVASFDIRYLWQRAFVLGITMPTWLPRDPKPWSDKVHDTMTIWGGRDFISLDNLCKALGIPGKGNMSGADVPRLWAEGDLNGIAAYCRADVERVRSIHRKMLLAMGEAA